MNRWLFIIAVVSLTFQSPTTQAAPIKLFDLTHHVPLPITLPNEYNFSAATGHWRSTFTDFNTVEHAPINFVWAIGHALNYTEQKMYMSSGRQFYGDSSAFPTYLLFQIANQGRYITGLEFTTYVPIPPGARSVPWRFTAAERRISPTSQTITVYGLAPEPTTWMLALLGMAIIGLRHRRST